MPKFWPSQSVSRKGQWGPDVQLKAYYSYIGENNVEDNCTVREVIILWGTPLNGFINPS